jgi:hypothetical protein
MSDRNTALESLNESVTRRSMLRRIGVFGLAATATAGLGGLLGAPAASAATTTNSTGLGSGYMQSTGAIPDSCDCTTLCDLNEGGCGSTHCPTGYCCFKCDGCGLKGSICLTGCGCNQTCYWCCNGGC